MIIPSRLWIHAASLGELEALRSLLQDPRSRALGPFHLTVLSVSGRAGGARRIPQAGSVGCAPLDLFPFVHGFLRRLRPRGLLILETELWPWTLAELSRRRIPVAVISGRLSARKWSGTRLMKPLLSTRLARMSGIAVQTEGDAERFAALGARPPMVTGNLKYSLQDFAQQIDTNSDELRAKGARAQAPVRAAATTPESPRRPSPFSSAGEGLPAIDPSADGWCLFVAGSLRVGEEQVVRAARIPGVVAVAAPRHLREREHWAEACRRAKIPFVLRSGLSLGSEAGVAPDRPDGRARRRSALLRALGVEGPPRPPASGDEDGPTSAEDASLPPVLILDTHGELAAFYALADVAFVGGTLAPIGGHNLFEPAREGLPIAFGPHIEGVREVADPLVAGGGGTCVRGEEELRAWLRRMERDDAERRRAGAAALQVARDLAGARDRTWAFLEGLGWPLRPERGSGR